MRGRDVMHGVDGARLAGRDARLEQFLVMSPRPPGLEAAGEVQTLSSGSGKCPAAAAGWQGQERGGGRGTRTTGLGLQW